MENKQRISGKVKHFQKTVPGMTLLPETSLTLVNPFTADDILPPTFSLTFGNVENIISKM